MAQVLFAGRALDPSACDVHSKSLIVEVPPPPGMPSLVPLPGAGAGAGAAGATGAGAGSGSPAESATAASSETSSPSAVAGGLAGTRIEVDVEVLVNGARRYATTFGEPLPCVAWQRSTLQLTHPQFWCSAAYKFGRSSKAAGAGGSSQGGDSDDDDSGDDREGAFHSPTAALCSCPSVRLHFKLAV
jgi:hypothetical protein